MVASILQNAPYILIGVVVVIGVITLAFRGRTNQTSDRARQQWILARLAEQEAAYPGGKFSDDEYLARVEALEEQWEDLQSSRY